jgi:hypothetical protein
MEEDIMRKRDEIRGVILLIAGAAIFASALLHGAVNVPHLRQDMLEIGVRQSLIGAVSLVLYFSVVAMFAFAAVVLVGAISSFRGRVPGPLPLWLVAACYVVFGLVAYFRVDPNAHYLGYAFMGLLVAAGTALSPSSRQLRHPV